MATKKVYFYNTSLLDENKNPRKVEELKKVLTEIIDENAYENGDYRSLDISPLTEPLHFVLDVFDYKDSRFFCRLSKQKPNSSVIQREYTTFKKNDVLPSGTEDKNGIELYTFGVLEYETGILSIASVQGAPGIKALKGLFEIYRPSYSLDIVPIPNKNAIESFYQGEDPEVSQIEIEVPLPDAATLEHVFGWKEDEYLRVLHDRNLHLNVTVKGEPKKSILFGKDESQNLIDKIRSHLNMYRKAKLRGKTQSKKTQDYNFFEENFSYPIDIADYHVENYQRVYYTVDELVDVYHRNLIMAYKENEVILRTITNK